MRKEEIARNEQFLLFPLCFPLDQKVVSPFVNIFDIISLFAAKLEKPKIGISGKGLITRISAKGFQSLIMFVCVSFMFSNGSVSWCLLLETVW